MEKTLKAGAWGAIIAYAIAVVFAMSLSDSNEMDYLAWLFMHTTPILLTFMFLGAAIGVVVSSRKSVPPIAAPQRFPEQPRHDLEKTEVGRPPIEKIPSVDWDVLDYYNK